MYQAQCRMNLHTLFYLIRNILFGFLLSKNNFCLSKKVCIRKLKRITEDVSHEIIFFVSQPH